MSMAPSGEQIPRKMHPLYNELTELTDKVCHKHLNEEYAELARKMAAALCRKRPSPLMSGHLDTWAASILYALGQTNFLFDKSQQLHMRADELCKLFGVSKSTASAKAGFIRKALNINRFEATWLLPSRLDDWGPAWMIQVNGLFVDARDMPYEVQKEAAAKKLIPYLPDPSPEALAEEAYDDAIEWLYADETDKAEKLLLESLEHKPDFVAAQLALSAVYERLSDEKQSKSWAETAYRTTLELFPSWPEDFTWGVPKYRPYLHAICDQACRLHIAGDTKEAVTLYRLLLQFTPGDNQGARYLLAGLHAGISPEEVNRMTDEGNELQDWSALENMLEEQNAKSLTKTLH